MSEWYLGIGFQGSGMLETSENTAPIRGFDLAAGLMRESGYGLHDTRGAAHARRERLLPHDAEQVRSDGHARFSWLLSQGSPERLR